MKASVFLCALLSVPLLVKSARKLNKIETDAASDVTEATNNVDAEDAGTDSTVVGQDFATIASETDSSSNGIDDLCRETRSSSHDTRIRAFKAILDLGSLAAKAMPYITIGLVDDYQDVRNLAQRCMKNLGKQNADKTQMQAISRRLYGSSHTTRMIALLALDFIGEHAHPEAEHIVIRMGVDDYQDIRDSAYQLWKKIGRKTPESSVHKIAAKTSSSSPTTRWNALQALERFGEKAKPATTEVTVCLVDDYKNVRDMALKVLNNIRTTNTKAVQAVCNRLRSTSSTNREIALWALYEVGDTAGNICLDQITLMLVDDYPSVRERAKLVLEKLNKAHHGTTARIASTFLASHKSTTTRLTAISALKWLSSHVDGGGSWAKPATDNIISAMSDPNRDVKNYAREALAMIQKADARPKVKAPKVVRPSTRDDAEDADCFCFKNVDYDEEAEYQKVGFAECAGMIGKDYQCASHCAKKDKYHITLSSENATTQTISYCQDDGDCKCLDADESHDKWQYKKEASFRLTDDRRLQGMNLGECYSKCNKVCKEKGWSKGGCIWPVGA